jgi:iron only hydrogenase large subunit-like protein
MQSHTEVLSVLSSNPPPGSADHKVPILSVSPQSLASLSAKQSNVSGRRVSPVEVFRSVKSFALKLGFEHVFDTTFARHLALEEHLLEFKERQSTRHRDPTSKQLPMLASACPGWICYAEKTHSEMLPFISRTKSPQQIMGTLVKEWLAPQLDTRSV